MKKIDPLVFLSDPTAADLSRFARDAGYAFPAQPLGIVKLTGQQAALYLHNRLTNGVKDLAPGQGKAAALLGPDGRMLLTLSAHRIEDGYIAVCEGALGDRLVDNLAKYGILQDVEVEDLRPRVRCDWFIGANATDRLREEPDGGAISRALASPHSVARMSNSSADAAFAIRRDLGRIAGILLVRPREEPEVDTNPLANADADLRDKALEILRIEEGIPRYGHEWDEKTIPLEVNLQHLIDYKKGCFPGQEIIARITNLGHPARALRGLRFEAGAHIEAGAPLSSESDAEDAGKITSIVDSPAFGLIALAVLRWNHREAGTMLRAGDGLPCKVVDLPFL